MTTESRVDRNLRRIVWGLSLTPTASLLLFWSFVLRARVVLGRWPTPYNPDPKDIGYWYYVAVFYGILAAVLSVPLLLAVAAVACYRQPRTWWRLALAFLLCVGILAGSIALHRLDPGGFSEWFGD
jgi:hypothetical protein